MKIKKMLGCFAIATVMAFGAMMGISSSKHEMKAAKAARSTSVYYFENLDDWSNFYLYAWTGEGTGKTENAGWPGVALGDNQKVGTLDNHSVYVYNNSSNFVNFIIHNNSGTQSKNAEFGWSTEDNQIFFNKSYDSNWVDKKSYTPPTFTIGYYLVGSGTSWQINGQTPMTSTGVANEYSITKDFEAGETFKVVHNSATYKEYDAWVGVVGDPTSNHPTEYPVYESSGNVQVYNAGNYTVKVNVSTGAYSVLANDYVQPVATIVFNDSTTGETSTYNASTNPKQSEILTTLEAGTKFVIHHVTSFEDVYRGYDSLGTGGESAITKGYVTKGSEKGDGVYYINVVTTKTFILYVKDDGNVWMCEAGASQQAYAWGSYFIANVGCDGNGVNTPSGWGKVSGRYSTLSDGAKELVIAAKANPSGDELQQAVSCYDYAVTHHAGLARFIEGRVIAASSSLIKPIAENTGNMTVVIIVVSTVAVLAIGGYFFLHKRKEY